MQNYILVKGGVYLETLKGIQCNGSLQDMNRAIFAFIP